MIEKLNKIISSYVEHIEIESMQDFEFISRIINIYNSNPKEFKILKYKKQVSIEESYNCSLEFFKAINPSYAKYLEDNIGSIYICQDGELLSSFCGMEEDEKVMVILSNETIADAYTITHELIHHMTLEEEISYARNTFCEVLSYFMEELQYEYLNVTKEIDEYEINSKENLSLAYLASEILEIKLNFIKIYLQNGLITMDNIVELYNESKNKNLYYDILQEILKNNELSIIDNHRIIIGIVFAYYILDRIKENKMDIEEFFELNARINEFEIEDFLNYLNLECTNEYFLNLKEKSYQKLETGFAKILKSR